LELNASPEAAVDAAVDPHNSLDPSISCDAAEPWQLGFQDAAKVWH
jgi:hypothetical protein